MSNEPEVTDAEILELIGTEPPEGAIFVSLDEDGDLILTSEEPE